mmetsp:Transcript_29165/g.94065  ORF Transcript_29165/g.94065 Transcript_29165/m.94065 type:complete len:302 (-) Transcript_29165:701-1606(-)
MLRTLFPVSRRIRSRTSETGTDLLISARRARGGPAASWPTTSTPAASEATSGRSARPSWRGAYRRKNVEGFAHQETALSAASRSRTTSRFPRSDARTGRPLHRSWAIVRMRRSPDVARRSPARRETEDPSTGIENDEPLEDATNRPLCDATGEATRDGGQLVADLCAGGCASRGPPGGVRRSDEGTRGGRRGTERTGLARRRQAGARDMQGPRRGGSSCEGTGMRRARDVLRRSGARPSDREPHVPKTAPAALKQCRNQSRERMRRLSSAMSATYSPDLPLFSLFAVMARRPESTIFADIS